MYDQHITILYFSLVLCTFLAFLYFWVQSWTILLSKLTDNVWICWEIPSNPLLYIELPVKYSLCKTFDLVRHNIIIFNLMFLIMSNPQKLRLTSLNPFAMLWRGFNPVNISVNRKVERTMSRREWDRCLWSCTMESRTSVSSWTLMSWRLSPCRRSWRPRPSIRGRSTWSVLMWTMTHYGQFSIFKTSQSILTNQIRYIYRYLVSGDNSSQGFSVKSLFLRNQTLKRAAETRYFSSLIVLFFTSALLKAAVMNLSFRQNLCE